MGEVVLVDYYNCADCNYQFLTEYDPRCPKCGNGNPKYSDIEKNNQELLTLITEINENIIAQVKEISLKIEKIEQQLRTIVN